jgi:hypothetical protein
MNLIDITFISLLFCGVSGTIGQCVYLLFFAEKHLEKIRKETTARVNARLDVQEISRFGLTVADMGTHKDPLFTKA